jgi:hypothetical protein
VAIRIRKEKGELFADGSEHKYFAVVTNVWHWEPKRLLECHREKAGTIEAIHDVLKNKLPAGVLLCGQFGANAAWLRLAVLTHNVMMALPEEYLSARPKRLRFLIFNTVAASFIMRAAYSVGLPAPVGAIGCNSCPCPPANIPSANPNPLPKSTSR